jgi:error-prone DNA polymerase
VSTAANRIPIRAGEKASSTLRPRRLVGQRSGSAKKVMFITPEDETDVGNLIVWPSLLKRQVTLSAGMLACQGRVQHEAEVIHRIGEHLINLSNLVRSVGASRRTSTSPTCGSGAESRSRPSIRPGRQLG